MTLFPEWMSKLVEIDESRRAEQAEQARLEALAEAAHQRMLGAALVEALAFVLDVALPAPDKNEIVLDGVKFWLNAHDVDPITERDADGKPTRFHFSLYVAAAATTIHAFKPRSYAFNQNDWPMPDREQLLRDLAAFVIELVREIRLCAAAGTRIVRETVKEMEQADNLIAANALTTLINDFELSDFLYMTKLIALAMDAGRDEDLAYITNYLLSA